MIFLVLIFCAFTLGQEVPTRSARAGAPCLSTRNPRTDIASVVNHQTPPLKRRRTAVPTFDTQIATSGTSPSWSLFGRKHVCHNYKNWKEASRGWDSMLSGDNIALCSRYYGGGGNCMYHSIAGILKSHRLTTRILRLTTQHLPKSIRTSLDNLTFSDEYYTVKDLRVITAIFYIGVNPHDSKAVKLWDHKDFVEKLEVTAALQGDASFSDILWNPSGQLKAVNSGAKPVDVAKIVFESLIQVSPPLSWGGNDDLVVLSSVFNLDIYLFYSGFPKIQLVKAQHAKSDPRPSLLIYYYEMAHFDAAGIVLGTDKSTLPPIVSMFASDRFPKELNHLVENYG
ncbi:hypothetical protein X943_001776 [Babesia divergens]|uniref:OTU domain-containing protein n=1 Tax=Babesia divergens TaxID=32595 RepID=A0AAD9G715_BABDI|nr:hypothetical protein X943_001776 [Babesia divergens]